MPYSVEKHCEKKRNCLLQAISPFLTMFSTTLYLKCVKMRYCVVMVLMRNISNCKKVFMFILCTECCVPLKHCGKWKMRMASIFCVTKNVLYPSKNCF